MKIFFPLFTAVAGCLLFAGCQKSGTDNTQTTKADHLAASAWKYESGGVDPDRNGTVDFPASGFLHACNLDNTATFKKDNTGVADEGAARCNTTDPQSGAFTWSFADGETSLNINTSLFALLNGKFKIGTLNATTLTLTKDTVIAAYSSQPLQLIVNLKH